MKRREALGDYAGLRNGDMIRQRDPWGARIIIVMSLGLVLFGAVKVFAHTVDEVRAMPRHIEGVE